MVMKTVIAKQHKREFRVIRKNLLHSLVDGQRNINQLAKDAGVNWKTTRNHMVYLCGFGFAKVVINLPQVTIYEITERGMEVLGKHEI
jgi:predicted transcriptional regulator